MALLQVSKITAAQTTAVLQVAKIEATVPSSTTALVLQIASISAVSATPSSAPSLTVEVDPTGQVAAGTLVTMTATPGGDWTSVAWSQTAGTTTNFGGTELVQSFVAPPEANGTLLGFAAVAQGPGGDTTVLVFVSVLPHDNWYLEGGEWLPGDLVSDPV